MKTFKSVSPFQKKLVAAGLAGALLLTGSAGFMTEVHSASPASGQSSPIAAKIQELLTHKTLKSGESSLKTNIRIPVFHGLKDAKYQAQLNSIIELHASKDLDRLEKEAKEAALQAKKNGSAIHPYELNISYELTSDGTGPVPNLISLKVITEASTGNAPIQYVDTYNILNKKEAERVTLENLFGNQYKQQIDSKIKAAIAADPEKYFEGKDGFQGIHPEQDFYVSGNQAVIVFQEYTIAPGSTGTPEFKIDLPGKTNASVSTVIPSKSILKANNGTVMIPLTDVLHKLQFKVKWNGKTKTSEISKGAVRTSVTVGKNSYSFGKMAPQKLGAAPVMNKGRVYVPLNFLTDILHASITKNQNGSMEVTLK